MGQSRPSPQNIRRCVASAPTTTCTAPPTRPCWSLPPYNDSQVPYWEPVKWLARLREHSTGSGPYLLLTELEGGHRAGGGDRAREFAFLLHLAGINQ